MIKKWLYLGIGLSFFQLTTAQNSNDKTPFLTINDSIYYKQDFERLYTKNLDMVADVHQKDVNKYFDLYVLYKLKLQEAYRLGLHEKESYKDEVSIFQRQLKEKFFINEKVLHDLVKEAVERDKYEVRASHILIKSPQENQKAYNKALEIREKIINGMDFSEAVLAYSEDPSAQKNKGDLGYFSVLKMVYPFESAAYNTPVGEVSLPIRSEFGYHLVYVTDKKRKPQVREISHIFVKKSEDNSFENAQTKAYTLYNQLQLGADFAELASTDSDDWAGRQQRGYFGRFVEKNFNIPHVGETVYDLQEQEFSQPIKSDFGYHLFKVEKIHPYISDDEAFFIMERKVKNDQRAKVLEDDLVEFLTKEYHFKPSFQEVKSKINLAFLQQPSYKPLKGKIYQNNAFTIENGKWSQTNEQMLKWVYDNKYSFDMYDEDDTIAQKAIEAYTLHVLKEYHEKQLPLKHPEYVYVLNEYKEGILLFDLMQSEVWEKARNNEQALLEIYEKEKKSFKPNKIYKGEIYKFNKKKSASKFLKTNRFSEKDISIYKGTFGINHQKLPNQLTIDDIQKGIISKNGNYYVFQNETTWETFPPFEELKSKIQEEYAIQFEKEYLENLKQKAKIQYSTEERTLLDEKYSKYKNN